MRRPTPNKTTLESAKPKRRKATRTKHYTQQQQKMHFFFLRDGMNWQKRGTRWTKIKRRKQLSFRERDQGTKTQQKHEKRGGEKGASRDPGLLLLTEPTHTSRHTRNTFTTNNTRKKKKIIQIRSSWEEWGGGFSSQSRKTRKEERKINSPSGDAIASSWNR